jgi:hypothetical protein
LVRGPVAKKATSPIPIIGSTLPSKPSQMRGTEF